MRGDITEKNGNGRSRTFDLPINGRMPYQLSHVPMIYYSRIYAARGTPHGRGNLSLCVMTLHAAYIRDQDGGYRTQHCSALTFISTHTPLTRCDILILKALQVRAITHFASMRFFRLNYVLKQKPTTGLEPATC